MIEVLNISQYWGDTPTVAEPTIDVPESEGINDVYEAVDK